MNITILKIILCLSILLFIIIILQTHETIIEGKKGKKKKKKKKKGGGGGNKKKKKKKSGGGGGGGGDEGDGGGDHDHNEDYIAKGDAIEFGNLTCDEVAFTQEEGLKCSNVVVGEGGDNDEGEEGGEDDADY